MPFFNTLNYSSCNEDGLAELRALNVTPGDHVCCVTGSGDRVLHMLLGDPSHVSAFDLNPVQNYLLELKLAAIRELDYPGYIQFLGLIPSMGSRWNIFSRLRPCLSQAAADWFSIHRRGLEHGILYAGRWERYFRFSARNLQIVRGSKIDRLLAFDDLERQRDFLKNHWNTWDWRLLLRLSFNRPTFRLLFGDPGFYAQVGDTIPPWRYIYEQMTRFLENHLARTSFMMALVFRGRFFDPVHYPPYLRAEFFPVLKARLPRVSIRSAGLFEMLNDTSCRSCNKYSLSDVSSFLNHADYLRLFAFFAQKPGVRFCLRDFLTQRAPPTQDVTGPIRFVPELQADLARDDASFGYTFIIGEHG